MRRLNHNHLRDGTEILWSLLFMYKSTPTDSIPGDAGEWKSEFDPRNPDEAAFKMMEKNRRWKGNDTSKGSLM